MQNRLPAKLSLELQGLMGEFEADIDLSQGRGNGHTVAPHSPAQSSGRAPQFPSQPALSAMEAAVQVTGAACHIFTVRVITSFQLLLFCMCR